MDPFDLICHIAFDKKALTRTERAKNAKVNPDYFEKYDKTAKRVIEVLLDQYQEKGYQTEVIPTVYRGEAETEAEEEAE